MFLVIDHFLRKYWAAFNTQHAGWCSIIWMITQDYLFVITLTGYEKTQVLVIETIPSQ